LFEIDKHLYGNVSFTYLTPAGRVGYVTVHRPTSFQVTLYKTFVNMVLVTRNNWLFWQWAKVQLAVYWYLHYSAWW